VSAHGTATDPYDVRAWGDFLYSSEVLDTTLAEYYGFTPKSVEIFNVFEIKCILENLLNDFVATGALQPPRRAPLEEYEVRVKLDDALANVCVELRHPVHGSSDITKFSPRFWMGPATTLGAAQSEMIGLILSFAHALHGIG
jgi:hypothetical protein